VEYLVIMTTHVPDGTPDQAVDDIRAREAAHSHELAAERHLLRLWRPPLKPGEWRSLGLFAADGDDELKEVLAAMPLRVWRTDDVTPLQPHPNDPGIPQGQGQNEVAPEFLTTFVAAIPHGTPAEAVTEAKAGEKVRARELAGEGHLERLWALPDPDRALGLWRAADAAEMAGIVRTLPLDPFMTTDIMPLMRHPSDPGTAP
jgi:muconolactone delta-isomerase